MKSLVLVAAGAAFGVALVVACGSMGGGVGAGKDAGASPADCAAWQVARLEWAYSADTAAYRSERLPIDGSVTIGATNYEIWDVPNGWEPFGAGDSSSTVTVRRCKP